MSDLSIITFHISELGIVPSISSFDFICILVFGICTKKLKTPVVIRNLFIGEAEELPKPLDDLRDLTVYFS